MKAVSSRVLILVFLLISTGPASAGQASHVIHHDLTVFLDPQTHTVQVSDTITLPPERITRKTHFLIHGEVSTPTIDSALKLKEQSGPIKGKWFGQPEDVLEFSGVVPLKHYTVKSGRHHEGPLTFTLDYTAQIHHPIQQSAEEYERSFSISPGIIDDKGAVLSASSFWIPWFSTDFVTFDMTVNPPKNWTVISQGKRTANKIVNGNRTVQWHCEHPMDEIYLIGGPFLEYSSRHEDTDIYAFLRSEDPVLAQTYLDTTAQYLDMYEALITEYPYSKFALVENFWETGYGMPSFTLLGSRIIRFPFILHSSYPHELLHNWWGNSAYVDYGTGNWCEGITAYLADHLIKEQRGQGPDYRRRVLQKFTDFVNENNDFPLTEFTARHHSASEAIGYGKALMLFHMLRMQLGDDQFMEGLRQFYSSNKFRRSSYADIATAFATVTGEDFSEYFHQWTTRTGAPLINLIDVSTQTVSEGTQVSITLSQEQEETPFTVNVPVYFQNSASSEIRWVHLTGRSDTFDIVIPFAPDSVNIDPYFDVFRRLHVTEVPPSLSRLLGTGSLDIVLSSNTDDPCFKAYEHLAEAWSSTTSRQISVYYDKDIEVIPSNKSVWIFGRDNTFAQQCQDLLTSNGVTPDIQTMTIDNSEYSTAKHTFVMTARHPRDPSLTVVWLFTDTPNALKGLRRKLPHYGKYSYLVFEGDAPDNVGKGTWDTVESPLSKSLIPGGKPLTPGAETRPALADLPPLFSPDRFKVHVETLCDKTMEGRGFGTRGLDLAGDYIAREFKRAGLAPQGDSETYFQSWQDTGGPSNQESTLRNVIGFIPGNNSEFQTSPVILSAHYDHLGMGWPDVYDPHKGKCHPGADDNASGVSVLLELAHWCAKTGPYSRPIIFIAFTGEEAGCRGSQHYIDSLPEASQQAIHAVLNLDTVGRLYGNELLILDSDTAGEFRHIFMGCSYTTGIPSKCISLDLQAGDQRSFIKMGIPAVQFFSGAHADYHKPTDTPDKIDYSGLAKIAEFTLEAVSYLAERSDPLSFRSKHAGVQPGGNGQSPRRVRTGIIPDFAFEGPGLKVLEVQQGSPAFNAGIRAGHIIRRVGNTSIQGIRDYSNILKQCEPGDVLKFAVETDKGRRNMELALVKR